jgi:general secretion pathway protein D
MVAYQALGHAGGGIARPGCGDDARLGFRAAAAVVCALMAFLLTGCYKRSVLPQSEGHVTTPAAKPMLADVPPPARVSSFVPAPKPAVKPPTYSVVVNEVPVKELLLALARDTKQNIDIHPGLTGLVSLNAINETLPAILDRVAKQVNLRYRIEGNTLIVSPDTPYMKTYRVNYVNMTRETTSTIGVSGQIQGAAAPGGAAGGSAAGGAGGTQSNTSSTVVKTVSNNNFWDSLRDNMRAILASTRSQSLTAEQRAERAETQRTAREERLQQAEAVARAGPAATQLFNTAFGSQPSAVPLAGDGRDDIIVNAAAGTISVLATEKQHALIQQHIDSVTQASQRQVLIEATIAEVTLSDIYQGGIDWSRLAVSGGINFTQSLISTITGTNVFPGSLTIGYANPTSTIGNIATTIKLLNQFGNTRVLSSPKLMALNNQTALLKVVDNIIYFSIEAATVTSANVAAITNFTTTPQTVPVGMVMSLTPQINDNGQVTLTVRPTITRIKDTVNDPNPSLCSAAIAASNAGKCLTNAVPQIQIREMESVLELLSGQTAILGGLMQDGGLYNRNAVPGVGDFGKTGFLSELFGARNDQLTKSELVIFLRATIIRNPSLESDELKFYQRFLPQQTDTPTATVPGEKAGAAK